MVNVRKKKDWANIPNLFTFFRVICSPLVAYTILTNKWVYAALITIFASFTDWADGFFARKTHNETSLGQLLDPLADKIFLAFLLIPLAYTTPFLQNVVFIACLRDILILMGGFYVKRYKLTATFSPTWISKINTCLQLLLGMAIFSFHLFNMPITPIIYLTYVIIGTTLISFTQYSTRFFIALRSKT